MVVISLCYIAQVNVGMKFAALLVSLRLSMRASPCNHYSPPPTKRLIMAY